MKRRSRTRRIDWFLVALWLGLTLLAVLWVLPFVFILFTSFKTEAEIYGAGAFAPPVHWAWQNYSAAWSRGNFAVTLPNSVIITVVKVPLGILLSAMGAYAITQMKIRGGKMIFVAIVMGTMIPFQVLLAPLFTLVNGMGLINTYVGVILPYIAFGVPYQIFVLRSFFRQIPKELSEAARIDGATHLMIFWRIFLPLSLPVLAALVILDFVATWNEFAMALVLLQDSGRWTLPLGLMSFQGQFSSAYAQLNAAIVMTVLPAVAVYVAFQKYFVGGLTMGAIKE